MSGRDKSASVHGRAVSALSNSQDHLSNCHPESRCSLSGRRTLVIVCGKRGAGAPERCLRRIWPRRGSTDLWQGSRLADIRALHAVRDAASIARRSALVSLRVMRLCSSSLVSGMFSTPAISPTPPPSSRSLSVTRCNARTTPLGCRSILGARRRSADRGFASSQSDPRSANRQ